MGMYNDRPGSLTAKFGLGVFNTVHFGGAGHRLSWSAAFWERWQTT